MVAASTRRGGSSKSGMSRTTSVMGMARQQRDAVVGLLAAEDAVVTGRGEFRHAGSPGPASWFPAAQPRRADACAATQQLLAAHAQRVHVPGGNRKLVLPTGHRPRWRQLTGPRPCWRSSAFTSGGRPRNSTNASSALRLPPCDRMASRKRCATCAIEHAVFLEGREGVGSEHLGPLVAVVARGIAAGEDVARSCAGSGSTRAPRTRPPRRAPRARISSTRAPRAGSYSACSRKSNSANSSWRIVARPAWKVREPSNCACLSAGSGSPVSKWRAIVGEHLGAPGEVLHELARQLDRIPGHAIDAGDATDSPRASACGAGRGRTRGTWSRRRRA